MSVRVLGIDPGLTRCGVGIVDVASNRTAQLVDVAVIRTPPGMPLEERLLAVGTGIEELLDKHRPSVVAIERVFAQHNLRTVMGTAQVSGVALHSAAKRGLPVALHTPSEVKAAITGYGSADKRQVQAMVARILGLSEVPKPADAADALAIAICHAWRSPGGATSGADAAGDRAGLTPAQAAWRAAERSTRVTVVPRRLAK
ncbi:MAG: crossover junction endodeoxyribonuclease RuvC [Microbacteriaceae bacterium]|jgi:crossover junction endodeoxyribonuclease RuvC|nr:crossover junction endodeoxyribonuclease RuvC [Microbacteriaceae bacterium]